MPLWFVFLFQKVVFCFDSRAVVSSETFSIDSQNTTCASGFRKGERERARMHQLVASCPSEFGRRQPSGDCVQLFTRLEPKSGSCR